jgi:amino acid adenylation domain-containing protein
MRATWQSLLWLLTKQSDLLVGDLCQGYRELETAVGLFAKFLPVPSHFEANSRFSEILKESAEATRRASEWREYFTWDYRAEAGAGAAGNSFFAAAFEFNEWAALASTDELKFSLHSQFVCFDRFKVKLCCEAKDSEVVAEFQYDSSLISERAMSLLAEQFTKLLNSAIRHPEALISELEVLGSKERQQLLVELNDTSRDYPTDRCIHELFEEQAARTPDSLAVVYENDSLSYAELNTRANQVAHYLKRLGAKPETTVALCMERSVEMIVGMLGILKAGGVYVPLEPSQPVERLGYMLEDVRPLAVLTQQRLLESFPAHTAPVLCLDADRDELARERGDNPPGGAAAGNLAYIIFTSGSTGRPKGVLVEHRQLVNYVHAIEERLSLSPGESYATVSTFAADLGHTCIFPSLSFGGCLHIISQERASDPAALSDYFTRQPVDVLKIVPSHLEALLASPAPEKVLPRRRLILGGESSRWELIETVRRLAPGCEIFNHYGPTETTVGTITFHVEEGSIGEHAANIPLGRPIANAEIYLLDGELRPVVTGMLGELYIGGAGVARGYLSHPAMTAEKFVPNPFATQPGARLYRTGDLARYRPSGDIEFAGRADNQIKFHGYRVELNEIRHALNRHPDVKDSVVVMLDDGNGLDVLVAYYISRRELEVGMLREFLSASILKETLPGIFVHLKKMPLTLNGKVNLAGLPTLEEVRQQAKQTFVAPRTPVEKLVADIWAEILRVEQVSIHDNFFEIGGHSLLATRVTTRLRDAFQIELPLRTIFEEPTVAMQAHLITQMQVDQTDDEELMQLLSEIAQLPDEELNTIHQE